MPKLMKRIGGYKLRAFRTPHGWVSAIFRDCLGQEIREAELPIYYKSPQLALTAAAEEVARMEVIDQLHVLVGEWCDRQLVSQDEMLRLISSLK